VLKYVQKIGRRTTALALETRAYTVFDVSTASGVSDPDLPALAEAKRSGGGIVGALDSDTTT